MSDKTTLIDKAIYLAKLDRNTSPLLSRTLLDLQKLIKEDDEKKLNNSTAALFVKMAENQYGSGPNGVINQLSNMNSSNILDDSQSKGKFK